ncbi:MAG: phosphonoacetaldehyde reductase [Aestuariibacter sp.]
MTESLIKQDGIELLLSDDAVADVARLIPQGKTLVVSSRSFSQRGELSKLQNAIGPERSVLHDSVTGNPDISDLDRLFKQLRKENIKNIVALGGGSVIDVAKVLSVLLSQNIENSLDLFEPHFRLTSERCFVIAIPTTAGTGAEVTPFATVWNTRAKKKLSLTNCRANIALLDPRYIETLPEQHLIYPGLDALSHAVESLWNKNRTVKSTELANKAIDGIVRSLPRLIKNRKDKEAQKELLVAASYAGLAICETKTALAHALSYSLTLNYGVPHGLACSVTLRGIVDTFGLDKLNLSRVEADKVRKLLELLQPEVELETYVSWDRARDELLSGLDPSRAANFCITAAPHQIDRIIACSASYAGDEYVGS